MIFRPDRAFTAALALAFLPLGACGEASAELAPVELARAELAAGNSLAAESSLERALDAGADKSEVAAFFGEAALQQGDFAKARQWLSGGNFSQGTYALGFRLLGRLEMQEGNLAAAGSAFDRSFAAEPDNSDLWVDIGRLRYLGGEQIQAVAAAEKALELDPKNADALLFRGQLARDAQGMLSGAKLLEMAVGELPSDVGLRLEYAATLLDAGRAEETLAVLRDENGIATRTPRGLYLQALVAARGGRYELARDLLARSKFVRDEVPAALLLSAIIDLEEKNFASASQTLARLHTRQPDNARIRDLLAFALSRSDGERELVRRFAGLAASGSGSAYLRTLVGRSYETLGERELAARFLDLAGRGHANLAVLPSSVSPDILTATDNGGGMDTRDFVRNAIVRQETSAAVRRARDLSSRYPGSADAYAILGDAEFAQGNKRAARQAYERSAKVRRPWPLALRLAGAQDNSDASRRLLEEYVRDNPMNGEAAALLADAFAAKGDWDNAVVLLEHAMGLGMSRVPWVLAARSVGAIQQDDRESALAYALAAHELQPLNPLVISTLLAALPEEETAARVELSAKLASLTGN